MDPFVTSPLWFSESQIDKPCRNGHEEEFIDFQTVNTLDDGTEMELCLWNYGDDAFWDVSIDKKRFGEHAEKDFLAYLEEKGLHLGNIEDSHGEKWKYVGIIQREDVYRVQYWDDEWWYRIRSAPPAREKRAGFSASSPVASAAAARLRAQLAHDALAFFPFPVILR